MTCAAKFGGFCPLPGQFALAVYTDRPRLFQKIGAIAGVKPQQAGDKKLRAVFPVEAFEPVAMVIRARQKRAQTSPRALRNLRSRAPSQP